VRSTILSTRPVPRAPLIAAVPTRSIARRRGRRWRAVSTDRRGRRRWRAVSTDRRGRRRRGAISAGRRGRRRRDRGAVATDRRGRRRRRTIPPSHRGRRRGSRTAGPTVSRSPIQRAKARRALDIARREPSQNTNGTGPDNPLLRESVPVGDISPRETERHRLAGAGREEDFWKPRRTLTGV